MKHFTLKLISLSLPLLVAFSLRAQSGPQLYNMSLDTWSKQGGVWRLYAKDAPASKRIWDTANPGLGKLGINSTTPEYEHVAVKGEGKAAARIESKKVAWAFVSGSLFNGRFVKLVDMAGVETELGTPFSSRPKTLSGYYHYKPGKINFTDDAHEAFMGRADEALIEVLLMDWDKPQKQVSHIDGFIDSDTDPHVIGRAQLIIKKGTSGYVHFDVPFEYRSGKTPHYIMFSIASSRLGGSGTGASGSVLYVDEFELGY
ncbi:MAG: PCMD domain-containing protein [Bacteroidales bacterium]|nr:PCMD domain-containing protein [Bacteroidales bacterium]